MRAEISKWVNLNSCSLNSIDFADKCRQKLSNTGVLLLPQFLLPEALKQTIKEAQALEHIDKRKLILAPDCGLGFLPRKLCLQKLKIITKVAKSFIN